MKLPTKISQLFKRPAAVTPKPKAATKATTPVQLVVQDSEPVQAKPEPQKPIESVPSPSPIQGRRVPGTKRQRKFERQVERAKKAIQAGEIKPQARPVSEHCQCARRTALSIIAKLAKDGVLVREGRGWKLPVENA